MLNTQPQGAYVSLDDLKALQPMAEGLPVPLTLIQNNNLQGNYRSRALSRGMEFEEVRIYQSGDDIRSIDWRVTARTQTTYVKRYQEEKERPVILLTDQRQSLFFGTQYCFKSVYACHLSALLSWSAVKQGDRVGGLILEATQCIEQRPAYDRKNTHRWLQRLCQANQALQVQTPSKNTQAATQPTLQDALKQLINSHKSGCECHIISDFYDINDECEKLLFQLNRHNKVTLYWLQDPFEQQLPHMTASLSDGKSKQHLFITSELQQQHQVHYQQKVTAFNKLCQSHRLRGVIIDISQPLSKWFFNKKGKH